MPIYTPSDALLFAYNEKAGDQTLQKTFAQQIAKGFGGMTSDVESVLSGDISALSAMCDIRTIRAVAAATGMHEHDLLFRSFGNRCKSDEEGLDVAGNGGIDADNNGEIDAVADAPVPAQTVSYRFVMSDSNPDREDDILSQDWKLGDFMRNPVGLYMHNRWDLPVGMWRSVAVINGQLRGSFVPTPSPAYPLSVAVADMLRMGALNAVSVGFIPTAVQMRSSMDETSPLYARYGRYIISPKLLECSIVTIPMHQNATRRSNDEPVSEKSGDVEVVKTGLEHLFPETKSGLDHLFPK